MGKPAARGDGVDQVQSPHGTGICCVAPAIHLTDKCSDNVFINGIGCVRISDLMQPHLFPCCASHAPPLGTSSSTAFINGRGAARKDDAYIGDGTHVIITGSGNVDIGD